MSRIWTKKLSPTLSATVNAEYTGAKFDISDIWLLVETDNIKFSLKLSDKDLGQLFKLVKEAKNGVVRFK